MRILLFCVLAFSTAFSTSSCKKESKDKGSNSEPSTASSSAGASRPIAKSDVVLATVQLPTGAKIEGLANAIDNIQPGASAAMLPTVPMVLAQTLGMDLSGANLDAPISVLVVDPKKHSKPLAMLVTPSDASKLEAAAKAAGLVYVAKKKLALIADAAVAESVQDIAFASLAAPPSEFLVRIYPDVVLAAFKDDLHGAFQNMSQLMSQQQNGASSAVQAMMLAYEEMILAIGDQTQVMEMRVGTADGASDFNFRMQPKAGTTMAALAQAQVPSTHALLRKLPKSTSGSFLFSGDLRAGSARQPIMDFSLKIMSVVMPSDGDEVMTKMLATWFESFDGQVAVNMNMDIANPQTPKFDATYLMGASDAEMMRTGWREMMRHMASRSKDGPAEMMGMKFDIKFEEKALEVDGVEVDRYETKLNLTDMNQEQRAMMAAAQVDQRMHVATFDDVAVMSLSSNSETLVKSAIEAARGKAPGYEPTGAIAAALARSTSLKESLVFTVDVGALAPSGVPIPFKLVTMGFGQERGALTMRMSIRK
jgi:hypothetical protein